MSQRPKIALYEPDIPQNTAAIIRTCACLGVNLRIFRQVVFCLINKDLKKL